MPLILEHAARLEDERDHALDRPKSDNPEDSMWAQEDALLAAANRTESTADIDQLSFEALESEAEFDHVLFDAEQFGLGAAPGSDEEEDFLGLPGLLEPDQVATLLHERQSAQGAGRSRKADAAGVGPPRPRRHRARSSTRWSRPTPARTAPRTPSSTPTCGATAAARRWTRRPPSR